MNERINELALEAKQYARKQMSHPMDPNIFSAEVFEQRFAELIIEECARICEHNEHFVKYSVASDYALKAAAAFKKNFGVE